MGKKLPGEKIVEIRYHEKKDLLTVAAHSEAMELLPLCVTKLLAIAIDGLHKSGTDYMDLMKMCKEVVNGAWEANGMRFEPVEFIKDADDPREKGKA